MNCIVLGEFLVHVYEHESAVRIVLHNFSRGQNLDLPVANLDRMYKEHAPDNITVMSCALLNVLINGSTTEKLLVKWLSAFLTMYRLLTLAPVFA